MSIKIGICGLAGSGKDTAAEMLRDLTGYPIKRYADELKKAAKAVFGDNFDNRGRKEVPVYINQDRMLECTFNMLATIMNDTELFKAGELYDDLFNLRTHISPREYQQILGTDIGRAIDPDIWTRKIKNFKGNCIVPDVRFPNELLDKNILMIRHDVPKGKVHSSEALATDLQLQTIEQQLDTVDHVVINNGTRTKLYSTICDVNKYLNI